MTLMSENSKSYKISIRECKYCGVGFCSGYALVEHYRVCTQKAELDRQTENAVDCTLCNVKFPTHADLVQHNQYHEGTHRFLCRICNRSYQSNPGRLKHEQLEHGSMPLLQCDACGKQFKRKDRLKDHQATKHSVATPHKCPYCDAAFKLRDYLRKHVNQTHPGKALATITVAVAKTEIAETAVSQVVAARSIDIQDNASQDAVNNIHMDDTGEVRNVEIDGTTVHVDGRDIDMEGATIHVVVQQTEE